MTANWLASVFRATVVPATAVALVRAPQTVEISTVLRSEQRWTGAVPDALKSVPNKAPLTFDGRPMWPEFIVLRLLENNGWSGAWVKNWGGRAFWQNPLEPIELPAPVAALLSRIEARAGGRGGGCWDIVAWCGDDVMFIESKQRGRDRLRLTQRAWLDSALAEGVPLSCFAIVEWTAP